MNTQTYEDIKNGQSVFTGGMLGYLGICLATALLSAVTLGLAYPWLMCWKKSWYAEHTYINGKQLSFDGTGGQLFGKCLLWLLLTILTIGIYGLWVPIKMHQWITSHTHFLESSFPVSSDEGVCPPPERKAFCPNCGAELSGGNEMVDKFHCRHCAAPADPVVLTPPPKRKAFCPNCGAELSDGNEMVDRLHCRHCAKSDIPDSPGTNPVGFAPPDESELD